MKLNAKNQKNIISKNNISLSILDDKISGIETNSREIVKWTFGIPSNITGPISSVKMMDINENSVKRFKCNIFDQVVVCVSKINEAGYKSLDEVKFEIKKKNKILMI